MNLQDREELGVNMKGPVVELLHEELQALGFIIPSEEADEGRFGKNTRKVVEEFQERHGLESSGKVDERTARAINASVDAQHPERYVVNGQVREQDDTPLPDTAVRAFDRDLRREELLGETRTDSQGEYEIIYTADQLRRAEKGSADLVVRAFDADDRELAVSGTFFNAPPVAVVDLLVEPSEEPEFSEYEWLLAELEPVLEDVQPAELIEEDIDFLVKETGLERQRIEILTESSRRARDTSLPAEAFYGWGRLDFSLKLETLLDQESEALRTALENAIDEHIIPDQLRESLNTIMERLEQLRIERGFLVSHEVVGRLLAVGTDKPLSGFTIRGVDLDASPEPRDLGHEVTDGNGLFTLLYFLPRQELSEDEDDEEDAEDERRLRLHIIAKDGTEIFEDEISVPREQEEVIEVHIPLEEETIEESADTANLELPAELLTSLSEHGIETLADIRREGGIAHLEGVDAEHPAIPALEAHARLSTLSTGMEFNADLINEGYDNVSDIAGTTRADFVSTTGEVLGDFGAAQVQVEADVQKQFLNNIIASFRADHANGFPSPLSDGIPEDDLEELFPDTCGCQDCEAAASPLAYLAELLDYAVTHLKREDDQDDEVEVTLEDLTERFHQPFGDLPASCEQVEQEVRQVRICIEVLRRYLVAAGLPASESDEEATLAKAQETYLTDAYTALLTEIGTSFEEIRLAQTNGAEVREELANRLGIPAETIDRLLLDLDLPSTDPIALTETALEQLFGLVDTTRDPLSGGAKRGDEQEQISRWNLDGVVWNRHTDSDGMIYVGLTGAPAANVVRVELFRDSDRTDLVASGERTTATGPVTVAAEDGSDLSGEFEIDFITATDTIEIVAVPHFLSARLQYLRSLWLRRDWPTDPYRNDAEAPLPIIDPDVIGPDDLRDPAPGNAAFDLWLKRREWADERLNELGGLTETVADEEGNDVEVPDVAALFDRMYQSVTYDPIDVTPWADSTSPDTFSTLRDTLNQGNTSEVEAAADRVAEDLHLTVEAFNQLVAIRDKVTAWKADPRRDPVTDEERRAFVSILVQAQKRALYSMWIDEEEDQDVELDPKLFWISLREPEVGDWPPVLPAEDPLIDPEKQDQKDLAEPTVGQSAIDLLDDRRTELEIIREELEEAYESDGFDALLQQALGDPDPGGSLQHDLDDLRSDLNSNDPVVAAEARSQIEDDLHMTVEGFEQLMDVRAKADDTESANRPTAEELEEILVILTSARKEKHEYDDWQDEEEAEGFVYWNTLKARLPRWRAAAETRVQWQQALQQRSHSPHIDPDLVRRNDLWNPHLGVAAELWQARREFITAKLENLANDRQNAETDLGGFDGNFEDTVGVPATELEALAEQRAEGEDIGPRLEQLHLTNESFDNLLRIRRLAEEEAPILGEEWEDVDAILTQVEKHREYATWRTQEREHGITLSPDFFKIPEPPALKFPPPQPEPLPQWRVTEAARRDWEETLQSRIDQEQSAIDGVQEAVSTVEEELLPRLRDALIKASDAEGLTLEAKAKDLTDTLLIDAQADGCQMTTRPAQASTTLQLLLWSLRSGQLQDTHPDLLLDADDFEEAWEWLGSYETWRAAMLVFLYPENVLLPSLRKWQTPAFQRLVEETRSNTRLTPEDACEAANTYADYFDDVAHLSLEASCQTRRRVFRGDSCRDQSAVEYRDLFYMFARGEKTNTVYWSAYDPEDETGYAQTFWTAVPGLENVVKILGAVPYEIAPEQRFIFLFAQTEEADVQKLVFTKFDLERSDAENRAWDSEPQPLDVPEDATTFSAAVEQRDDEQKPPHLAIHIRRQGVFSLKLNSEGTGWDGDDPRLLNTSLSVRSVLSLVGVDTGLFGQLYLLIAETSRNFVQVGFFLEARPDRPIEDWSPVGHGTFVGAFEEAAELYVFLANNSVTRYGKLHAASFGDPLTLDFSGPIGLERIAVQCGNTLKRPQRRIACQKSGSQVGLYRSVFTKRDDGSLDELNPTRVAPRLSGPFEIPEHLSQTELQLRRHQIAEAFQKNEGDPASVLTYLEEAYYFVPVHLALQLQQRGQYMAALDWFRTVYDYSVSSFGRKISYYLKQEESLEAVLKHPEGYLEDPMNPHRIARTRADTYTRFTLVSLVRCLLAFADAEFTRDTFESLQRARTLYMTALELLDLPELDQQLNDCDQLIGELDIDVGREVEEEDAALMAVWDGVKAGLHRIRDIEILEDVVARVRREILTSDEEIMERLTAAHRVVAASHATEPDPPRLARVIERKNKATKEAHGRLLQEPVIAGAIAGLSSASGRDYLHAVSDASGISVTTLETEEVDLPWLRRRAEILATGDSTLISSAGDDALSVPVSGHAVDAPDLVRIAERAPLQATKIARKFSPSYVPTVTYSFCIPPNPVVSTLILHAELNLYKIRTCRNIAGDERQLEPYAAPTDTETGMLTVGGDGELVLPDTITLQPTPYRYEVIVERAKRLVGLAQQIESAFLSTLEKQDSEYFQRLKARQELGLTRAGVRLQDLRVKEAEDGVEMAELQRERAGIQFDHFHSLLIKGLIQEEEELLFGLAATGSLSVGLDEIFGGGIAGTIAGNLSALGLSNIPLIGGSFQSSQSAKFQYYQVASSFERRRQDWQFQRDLAKQDGRIASQQVRLAQVHVRVVGQERRIAELQADHAEETADFLANKFTNVDLYDWMSGVLEGVYSFFLLQATSMAQLAEGQLAFERQEVPPSIIQSDYWEAPLGLGAGLSTDEGSPDRRGLTGSARLLQDIEKLDLYAFETDERKLQLTKTVSLARMAPAEFQRFRETGVLRFNTPMEMFDRDYPGHYLRLIKRVRTSVIALIPPTEGIKATLSSTGLSRVVIGNDGLFQETRVSRPPESVALSSPDDATGMFELTPQTSEKLFPFESMGVDTAWEFQLPKAANQFDFSTIADVLLTIEYTALESPVYREQVIQELDDTISADRPFSFRQEFADEWYDLNHPDLIDPETGTPMVVTFETRLEDFPPNIDQLEVQHIVLFFVREERTDVEVTAGLDFTPEESTGSFGGSATSVEGIISTRRGNAGAWTSMIGAPPVGTWTLDLTEDLSDGRPVSEAIKNEEIEDILFVVTYQGRTPEWPG